MSGRCGVKPRPCHHSRAWLPVALVEVGVSLSSTGGSREPDRWPRLGLSLQDGLWRGCLVSKVQAGLLVAAQAVDQAA